MKFNRFIMIVLILMLIFSNLSFATEDLLVKTNELTPFDASASKTDVKSYGKGIEILKNSYFNDIDSNVYEKDITKLASLDVIKKFGDNNYYPSTDVTGYEALGALVRLSGRGSAVETRALPQTTGMNMDGIRRIFNQEYLNEAQTLGIVLANETRDNNVPVTRENFALWLGRAIGITPATDGLTNVYAFSDFEQISPSNRSMLESIVRNNIMIGNGDGSFNPKGNLNRGMLAYVIDNALPFASNLLSSESKFAVVLDIQNYDKMNNNNNVKNREITVRNIDGTFSNIKTSYNPKTRQKSDFVSYKNGIVSDSSNIAVGDLIEYTLLNKEVHFIEVIKDESLISKINKDLTMDNTLKKYYGTISNISFEKVLEANKFMNKERFRIKNFDGQIMDLLISTDLQTHIKKDAVVYRDGKFGGTSLLKSGDDIEYLVKDNKVVYIAIKKIESKKISGTIRHLYQEPTTKEITLSLLDYDDNIVDYRVSKNVLTMINNNYGEVMDLQYGEDVVLTLTNGSISKIVSDEFIENPGYIPKYGKVRFGTIYYLYPDSISVELSSGEKNHFVISKNIPIVKNGTVISSRALKEGDKIKVYFDDIYSNKASLIVVEAAERIIKQVYKGRLSDVNEITNTITINRTQYLKNKDWVNSDNYSKDLKLKKDAEIYINGSKINVGELSKIYKGSDVYIVVENSFGKEIGIKMNIKSGGERFYYDKINIIDKNIGEMELNNQINFKIDDGTIVLKDSRILKAEKLKAKSDAFIVAGFNSYNNNYANIVKINSKGDDAFENIYIGSIEEVHAGYFNMTNNATISDNVWESIKESKSQNFYFNNDSYIKDLTKNKEITFLDFFHDKYAKKETEDINSSEGLKYKRYYGVVVTDEKGQVIGLNIRQKGLMKDQNIDDKLKYESDIKDEIEKTVESFVLSRGIIDEVQSETNRVKLTDALDWIDVKGMWVQNPVDKYVEYDSAIIIKNGKVVSYEDLKPTDYVYIMRSKEKGLVIVVE
ncbi:S-layer homology domain-containing protein [Helicovermis profundi]|uniref:SLH domain-containing protein n=1 Tax=Helicovermis profundi TaxID=3065157 RepID=A0AAU9EMT1_9FIRM|nr:hypothetical protein HLPR_00910 [Clostridia bacterium S502]